MYAPTSIPLVRRTRATFRKAEFGFFGVVVYTLVHTPRRWGAATRRLRPLPDFRPGVASFFLGAVRPFRISWLVVGMRSRRVAGAIIPACPNQNVDHHCAGRGSPCCSALWWE